MKKNGRGGGGNSHDQYFGVTILFDGSSNWASISFLEDFLQPQKPLTEFDLEAKRVGDVPSIFAHNLTVEMFTW